LTLDLVLTQGALEKLCIEDALEARLGHPYYLVDCGGGGNCGILVLNYQLRAAEDAPITRGELVDHLRLNPDAPAYQLDEQVHGLTDRSCSHFVMP
jgi:hypothetical protein